MKRWHTKIVIQFIDNGKKSTTRNTNSKSKVYGSTIGGLFHTIAHINLELCSSIGAFKYLFKYVFKGGDRTTAVLDINGNKVPQEVNEIADYLDARYVSAPEGIWRIFQFKMHHRKPAVQRLQIHLPNQQTITFSDDTDIITLLANDRLQKTTL